MQKLFNKIVQLKYNLVLLSVKNSKNKKKPNAKRKKKFKFLLFVGKHLHATGYFYDAVFHSLCL